MGLAERLPRPDARWLLALLGGCLAIGIVSGLKPEYGVGAAAGLAFAAVTMVDLTVGLVVFTGLSFLEVLNSTSDTATSFMKVIGLILFASWYAQSLMAKGREASSPRTSPVFTIACVTLLAWSALSISWAVSEGAAASSTSRYLLNILLFPIVLTGVRRRDQLTWVLAAFVIGAAISSVYGFLTNGSIGQPGRLTGGIGDANEEAAVLVAAIPLAIGLAGTFWRRPFLRAGVLGLTALCLVGVVTTLSRGGLISLAAMMGAGVLFGGRWRTRALVLLLVTCAATGYYFLALAPLAARQRVTMSDTSGRTDIWKVGWRMVKAQPFTGVGSGNFQNAEGKYISAPGQITNADLIVTVPHVAHNIYLEILADMGIPALLAFLTIVGAALASALRAARIAARTGQRELELMARCLAFALVGFMTADFFLSGEFSKQLWLVFALCPAVLAIVRTQAAPALTPAD